MRDCKNRLYLVCFLLLQTAGLWAQHYTITGSVLDDDTGEGLAFCSVYFAGTNKGVTSDVDGKFTLSTDTRYDSITVTYLGYFSASKALQDTAFQEINFRLFSSQSSLEEVVIFAGENPANIILKNIIRHKPENRLERFDNYASENYTKVELDFIDVSEKLQDNKLLAPFKFVFDNIDSISDEKPFLPVYVTETLSDKYAVKGAGKPRDFLKAQRVSGEGNTSMVELLNRVNETIDIYDDWYLIMEKSFASPFSNQGLLNYEYYLLDSTYIDGAFCYKIKFKPRRRQEPTFFGDFWVADSSFAVVRVNMRMSPDCNVNLVSRVIIYHENSKVQDSLWLPNKQKIVVDFKVIEKQPGVILRRTATFRDYRFDQPGIINEFGKNPEDYDVSELKHDDTWWQGARHESLTKTEAAVYQLVDSIQNLRAFKTWYDIFSTLSVGYKELGKIEIGTWYSLYSTNPVEGRRFRLGAWTSNNFSTWVRFGGYAAYGVNDDKWKYGADIQWNLKKRPRIFLGASYKRDITSNSENSEALSNNSVFTGLYRRDVPYKQLYFEEGKVFYEQNWFSGLRTRVTALHRYLDPYDQILENGGGFRYAFSPDPAEPSRIDSTINTTELVFTLRYAKEEKFITGEFFQTSLGSKYPIIELQYTAGIKGIMGSQFDYHKIDLSYHHWFYINPFGWFNYWVETGKTFGTVPFLLAEVHPGNETLSYDPAVYNAINQYEFASDAYVGIKAVHHFEGFFFNKIPLLRKLKWREVIFFRGLIGSMSEKNRQANALNAFNISDLSIYTGYRTPSSKPYMETGVGIENIFRVIRIDAIWRLTYLDNPQAPRFGIRGGFSFYF